MNSPSADIVSREAYALLGGSGPDPVTLCDSALGVLARPGADASVIGAFYDARRAGVSADRLDLILELRTDDGSRLVSACAALPGVESVNLLAHDGEVRY